MPSKEHKRFSTSYNIITYDLLGHGDDKGEAIEFSLQRLVDQLLNLYEKKAFKSSYLRFKLRLLYLYHFCTNAPRKVLSICHIGGHYNNPSLLYSVFQNFWEKRGDDYSKWLSQYANTIFPSGILKANPFAVISRNIYYRFGLQLHSSIIAQSLRHRLEFDLKSKLKSLPHPILWVMGEHDHLYKSCLFDLKSILPNVLYKEIPLAGHAANLFRPNYFHDLYDRF